jgi:phage terminase large subunit
VTSSKRRSQSRDGEGHGESAPAGPSWLADLEARATARKAKGVRREWPCPEYQSDPVRFCSEILNFEPWDKQADIMRALVPPDARVSVASGHKVGKSALASGLAHWFSSSFHEARVVLMAPKAEHTRLVIWREVTKFYKRSGLCKACREIEARNKKTPKPCAFCSPLGDPDLLSVEPHRGLRYPDGREVFGYTARDKDAIGGLSGENLLFIFDEASGIDDDVFEGMKGNGAGGARALLIGNPLRTTGEFYESRHAKKKLYVTFVISSEETPNAKTGTIVIPALATRKYCDDMAEEYGRDSVLYGVRVQGKDPKYEEGQLVHVDVLDAAVERWNSARAEGRLQIGVDVGFTGDEAAIACRRGLKIFELTAHSELGDEDTLAAHVMSAVHAHVGEREPKPLVVYDSNGPGAKLGRALRVYADEIDVFGVSGIYKPRHPKEFFQLRDEVACHFASWLKTGAIPKDGKLEGEIMRTKAFDGGAGRKKVITNEAIKKILGRSPDRRNACELAVWPARAAEVVEVHDEPEPREADPYDNMPDPYGSTPDPYGGDR